MHLFFLIFIITINSNVFAENLEPNTYYDFIVLNNNKYFTITSENSIKVYDKNHKRLIIIHLNMLTNMHLLY